MDFITPALGAIVGFVLAQFVSVGKFLRDIYIKPKLKIETSQSYLLLSHVAQVAGGEMAGEKYFGFTVRNVGKRIATGVRFQILAMRFRTRKQPENDFSVVIDTILELSTYQGADGPRGSKEATLVPGAGVTVALGWWREDHDTVRPMATNVPDYFEETCSGAIEYEFDLVAFNDRGDFEAATIRITPYRKHGD
jgi:hypothetical protein